MLVTFTARAALFDDDEARKRIEATNQRLTQVQKEVDDRIAALETQLKSQGLIELFNQVELLKSDVARLRGQIEVLTYEQAEGQKRQRDLYVDLDTRLRKIEGGAAAPAAAATPPVPPEATPLPAPTAAAIPAPPPIAAPAVAPAFGPPPGTPGTAPPGRPAAADVSGEQRAYDAALDSFKAGNYGAAISGFAAFVKTYPKSPLAPSAQYWLGNGQFAQKDYRGAIASQRQLLAIYPDSQKVPDALLNIATSQFEMGDALASRRSLEDLIARYPQSDAAGKARQRLAGK
jgi:tol-pal system protein YbgF